MSAYPSTTPLPITPFVDVEATINGYRWNFTPGSARVLTWSVSGSQWNHPVLQSAETQEDFKTLFSFVSYYIDARFQFLGHFESSAGRTGYQAAQAAGSNLNISMAYDGQSSSGQMVRDGMFTNAAQTAFCLFPSQANDGGPYRGAAGDTWLNWNNPFIRSLDYEVGSEGFALLLHEVLHGLGLKHPHDDGGTGRPTYADLDMPFADRQWISVMSYDRLETGGDGAYDGSMPIAPMIMDVIALQCLYGESSGSAGDSSHDLSLYLGEYYNTLWDSSGADTLDATQLPFGVLIDLGSSEASNGIRNHNVGFITTAADALGLATFGYNPTRWTWLWGEYENFNGSGQADTVIGNGLDNRIVGGAGADMLDGAGGNDSLRGGTGIDTAIFQSARAGYAVQRSGADWRVRDLGGAEGEDTLVEVERADFLDRAIALDTQPGGHAHSAALALRALAGTRYLQDPAAAGQVLGLFDAGRSMNEVVASIVAGGAFLQLAGSRSNTDFVELVYRNVVGLAPTPDALGFYVGLLDSGQATQVALGALAAVADINASSIDIVGVVQNGLTYFPAEGG